MHGVGTLIFFGTKQRMGTKLSFDECIMFCSYSHVAQLYSYHFVSSSLNAFLFIGSIGSRAHQTQ